MIRKAINLILTLGYCFYEFINWLSRIGPRGTLDTYLLFYKSIKNFRIVVLSTVCKVEKKIIINNLTSKIIL